MTLVTCTGSPVPSYFVAWYATGPFISDSLAVRRDHVMDSGSCKLHTVVHTALPHEISCSLTFFPQLPVSCRRSSKDSLALGWREPGFPSHCVEGHLPSAHIGVMGKKNIAAVF